MKRTKLDIYEYSDFRSYLKDRLAELKAFDKKYSLRYLAKKLDLSSNSHLKMVMDGNHNISLSLAKKVCIFFGLNKKQTDFFLVLVRYAQAKNDIDKADALEELREVSRFVKLHKLELDQFDYYNDKLTLVLREMICLPNFDEDHKWIQQRLPFRAGKKSIFDAIEKLLRLGLVLRDDSGKLAISNRHIFSGHGFGGEAIKGYYRSGFKKAAGSLDLPGTERHLGGMTMAVSLETYEKIVKHFGDFMDNIRTEIDADQNPEKVYQLVMGLFPLTKSVNIAGD